MAFSSNIFEKSCRKLKKNQSTVCIVFQLSIMATTFFKNVLDLSEAEKYRLSKHFDRYIIATSDCHTWQGRTDAYGYGEIRFKFRGVRLCLKAHRVVFALANPHLPLQTGSYDVSHLCHNRQCVKPEHLSYEPHSVNNKRLACKNEGECGGHRGYNDCLL